MKTFSSEFSWIFSSPHTIVIWDMPFNIVWQQQNILAQYVWSRVTLKNPCFWCLASAKSAWMRRFSNVFTVSWQTLLWLKTSPLRHFDYVCRVRMSLQTRCVCYYIRGNKKGKTNCVVVVIVHHVCKTLYLVVMKYFCTLYNVYF